jgi:hypothetical protein
VVTNKAFEELSNSEIRYVLSLNYMEIKNYLIKIHGEKCFWGFIKRYVNCPAEELTPSKVIKQNELIHSRANLYKL